RKRGLDRIHDVTLINRRVNLGAMAADRLEISMRIVVQDLVDLSIVERGVKASGHPLGTASSAASREDGNRPQRRLDPRRGKTHGTWELRVEQQELRDSVRPEIGRVAAAVRFER